MSYAGIIKSVNGTTVDTNSDSMFLGTGKIAELENGKAFLKHMVLFSYNNPISCYT